MIYLIIKTIEIQSYKQKNIILFVRKNIHLSQMLFLYRWFTLKNGLAFDCFNEIKLSFCKKKSSQKKHTEWLSNN